MYIFLFLSRALSKVLLGSIYFSGEALVLWWVLLRTMDRGVCDGDVGVGEEVCVAGCEG